ncbi:hypothetical protein BJ741DRAFT_611155 [Chytriomyces cf. hyalinus JEL632]|nr:hypothetical protein BJ741DRAFT_611155 [Chytriomyces cf. hyalinus JEL632]
MSVPAPMRGTKRTKGARKKIRTDESLVANGRGLDDMPTELFDEVCLYLKGSEVLNLGCINKRLAGLTGEDSRVWMLLRTGLGYPAYPSGESTESSRCDAAGGSAGGATMNEVTDSPLTVSDKTIVRLCSRMGCMAPGCSTRTRTVDWMQVKRLCAKCTPRYYNDEFRALGYEAVTVMSASHRSWHNLMRIAVGNSMDARKSQLDAIRRTRRDAIEARFAAMRPVAIDAETLRMCEGFHKAATAPTALTDRIFNNLVKTLAPQIKERRIAKEADARWAQLRREAVRNVPAPWNAIRDSAPNFFFIRTLFNLYGETFTDQAPNTVHERRLRMEVVDRMKCEIAGTAWDQPFPAFDMGPYVARLEKELGYSYNFFIAARGKLLEQYPHLADLLTDEAIGAEKTMSDEVMKIFERSPAENTKVAAERRETQFSEWVMKFITNTRLAKLFPDIVIGTRIVSGEKVPEIRRFGLPEWFSANEQYFDYKQDNWNFAEMEKSSQKWLDTVTARSATVIRHLVGITCSEILENPFVMNNELPTNYSASAEFRLLSDLPERAVKNVRSLTMQLFTIKSAHPRSVPLKLSKLIDDCLAILLSPMARLLSENTCSGRSKDDSKVDSNGNSKDDLEASAMSESKNGSDGASTSSVSEGKNYVSLDHLSSLVVQNASSSTLMEYTAHVTAAATSSPSSSCSTHPPVTYNEAKVLELASKVFAKIVLFRRVEHLALSTNGPCVDPWIVELFLSKKPDAQECFRHAFTAKVPELQIELREWAAMLKSRVASMVENSDGEFKAMGFNTAMSMIGRSEALVPAPLQEGMMDDLLREAFDAHMFATMHAPVLLRFCQDIFFRYGCGRLNCNCGDDDSGSEEYGWDGYSDDFYDYL